MTPLRSFLVAAAVALAAAAPALAGSARQPPLPRARPCAGPAVELDPDRFACAAKRPDGSARPAHAPGVEVRRPDDSGIDVGDGVSLEGRLGPRDAPASAPRTLDNVATKRTAIVPPGQDTNLGKSLRHGASDGIGLGLSFDFESP